MSPMLDGVPFKRLRKLQGNRCYLCGERFMAPYPRRTPDRKRLNREGRPTHDHVRPRSAGHTLNRNKLLAHAKCNLLKGNRQPFACELLFLDAVLARASVAAPTPTRDRLNP